MVIDQKNVQFKKKWSIENIVMIVIKYLEMIQILALNNPYAVKQTKPFSSKVTLTNF